MTPLETKGSFTIISKTAEAIANIAGAARICYKSQCKASPEADKRLVQSLINKGHHAMVEFGDMTVVFEGISRGFTHEQVRHRHASYAQQSTRYVDEGECNNIVPPHMVGEMGYEEFLAHLQATDDMYRKLRKMGWKPEDARQLLTISTEAPIVVKANLREWRHIFHMRCDIFAHWEIRSVMLDLLRQCQEEFPLIFDDFHFMKDELKGEYARKLETPANIKTSIDNYFKAGTANPMDVFRKLVADDQFVEYFNAAVAEKEGRLD